MSVFPFSDEQKMLRDTVRDFVNAEIKPIAHLIDEQERIPPELIQKIKDLGLLGTSFPRNTAGGLR